MRKPFSHFFVSSPFFSIFACFPSIYCLTVLLVVNQRLFASLQLNRMSQSSEKILKVIKWTNIITSIAIIAFGITGLIFIGISSILGAKFFMVFSPIFMTLFGVVLLATECKLDFVLKRVGFLRTLLGRGIFNIQQKWVQGSLSSEVFYYFSCGSNDGALAWVFGVALFALGILYVVLQFCGGSEYTRELKERLSA